MRTIAVSLTVLLALAGACHSQRAQDPPDQVPSCQILRARTAITVDGHADEADWKAAAPIDFIFPWNDVAAEGAQSTVARMLWDDDNLYIVYECVDPYLDSEVTEHDGPVYAEDAVEIFATPNAANLNAYFGYEMNINCALLDYIAVGAGEHNTEHIHFDWESEGVEIATTADGTLNLHDDRDRGWVLEISIPFDNFRHLGGTIPPRDGDLWRLNLNRTKGHEGQFSQWSDTHAEKASFHHSAYFGKAVFSTAEVGE